MSQSDAHRKLVTRVARALALTYPHICMVTDLQQRPGDAVPPIVGGYRPDVYAGKTSTNPIVIAEAKTDKALAKAHTHNQIRSFIQYLDEERHGLFILSVTGCGANRGKTLLRFMRLETQATSVNISIFDGLDFWWLDPAGNITWHLS